MAQLSQFQVGNLLQHDSDRYYATSKNGHLQQDCLKNMTHLTQLQMHQSQSPLFLQQNKHSNQKKQLCQQIAKKNVHVLF